MTDTDNAGPASSARQDVDPKKWGPSFWRVLEALYHSFPETTFDQWTAADRAFVAKLGDFLTNLDVLLPCGECRVNTETFLRSFPVDDVLYSKHDLWSWIVRLRRHVAASVDTENGSSDDDGSTWLASSQSFFFPPPPPPPVVASPAPAPVVPSPPVVQIPSIVTSMASYPNHAVRVTRRRSRCCGR